MKPSDVRPGANAPHGDAEVHDAQRVADHTAKRFEIWKQYVGGDDQAAAMLTLAEARWAEDSK